MRVIGCQRKQMRAANDWMHNNTNQPARKKERRMDVDDVGCVGLNVNERFLPD